MGATSIEWTEKTWNPIRGCSRVSEGCRNCYAERVAARFSGEGLAFEGLARRTPAGPRWTGEVRLVEEHLSDPLRWRRPARVFVNSVSDLFHERVPDETIAGVFGIMAAAPAHRFQVLTKRAERLPRWLAWIERHARAYRTVPIQAALCYAQRICTHPRLRRTDPIYAQPWPLPNVELGVSVEDQPTAEDRIPKLLEAPAAVHFVSAEPLLGPIDFRKVPKPSPPNPRCPAGRPSAGVRWIIVGGESGPGARPCELEWIRSIDRQTRAAGVALFVKQWGSRPLAGGEPVRLRSRKGGDPAEWPEDVRRRELPRLS